MWGSILYCNTYYVIVPKLCEGLGVGVITDGININEPVKQMCEYYKIL